MPSPFPGMNPYLEEPRFWEPFHDRLIFQIGEALFEVLPPDYVAEFRQRTSVVLESREIVPDVAVLHSGPSNGGVAVLTARPVEAATIVEVAPTDWMERYIEILYVPDRTVVAVIELASPTNKVNAKGREDYLKKQSAVLRSDTHLVEIDLLRRGQHWVAVPHDATDAHQPFDYVACVSRFGRRSRFECYFFTVQDPLPALNIPLLPKDADVRLDLPKAFQLAFEHGRLAQRLDYSRPLRPQLRAELRDWVRELLAGVAGARP